LASAAGVSVAEASVCLTSFAALSGLPSGRPRTGPALSAARIRLFWICRARLASSDPSGASDSLGDSLASDLCGAGSSVFSAGFDICAGGGGAIGFGAGAVVCD
jgi:hypothetical protein